MRVLRMVIQLTARLSLSVLPQANSFDPTSPEYGPNAMLPLLFADRARKVMQLAREEACRLNHENINTEHVLLGLLRDGTAITPSILEKIERDFGKIPTEALVDSYGSS